MRIKRLQKITPEEWEARIRTTPERLHKPLMRRVWWDFASLEIDAGEAWRVFFAKCCEFQEVAPLDEEMVMGLKDIGYSNDEAHRVVYGENWNTPKDNLHVLRAASKEVAK